MSVNRITGMFSGMDTESLVQNLMQAQRTKFDKIFQQKTQAEWKKTAYSDVNTQLKAIRDKFLSTLSGASNMTSASTYKANKVNIDAAQGVSVTAGANAEVGHYSIEVLQRASGRKATSSDKITTDGQGFDATKTTLLEMANRSGKALQSENGLVKFEINGEFFSFKETDSVQKMLNTVNASKADVSMKYSQLTDSFSIEAKGRGKYVTETDPVTGLDAEVFKEATLDVENVTGNLFGAGGIFNMDPAQANFLSDEQKAIVKINGVEVTRDTNTFTIDGINYNLNRDTTDAISFTVERDVSEAVDKIKEFVQAYNDMYTSLYSQFNEKKYRDFAPLTDEQRGALTETEAKLWDEKAKSGLLRSDSYLRGLMSDMKNAMVQGVGGADGAALSSIGITFNSWNGSIEDLGKMTIDENKLRAALEENPDRVASMFSATSSADTDSEKFKEQGVANRMRDVFNSFINNTESVAIKQGLDVTIEDYTKRMSAEETRLSNLESRYWAQFTALETAMAKLQSQSNWFAQQLGGSSS